MKVCQATSGGREDVKESGVGELGRGGGMCHCNLSASLFVQYCVKRCYRMKFRRWNSDYSGYYSTTAQSGADLLYNQWRAYGFFFSFIDAHSFYSVYIVLRELILCLVGCNNIKISWSDNTSVTGPRYNIYCNILYIYM